LTITQNEIRVEIIGANTEKSWAKLSHVPAIKGFPGLRLAAVATRNERRAGNGEYIFIGARRYLSA